MSISGKRRQTLTAADFSDALTKLHTGVGEVEHLSRNRDNEGMSTPPQIGDVNARDLAPIKLCVAMFGLMLLSATWPLWFASGDYPSIPWFRGLLIAPESVDRLLASGVVLSGLAVAWLTARQWWRDRRDFQTGAAGDQANIIASTIWIACLTGSMLLDQHRVQVWAWEFLWLMLFLTLATPRTALSCCRALVIGIYFYSAVSKLDAGFVQTQGPWLWQGLQRAMRVEDSTAWGSSSSPRMLAFPLGELLIAGLLGLPRTRRWGVAGSAVMHLTLLLVLGPLGRDQLPGVLLWNLFFLVSVPQLFWGQRALPGPATEWFGLTHAGTASPQSRRTRMSVVRDALPSLSIRDRFCLTAIVGLSLWPALEGVGLCDHWPAWAVYSSRPEVVVIQISDDQVTQLPLSLQSHVGPAEALSSWRPISIDQWSFETRRCPTYPQSRYRLAVARHLEETYGVTLRVSEQSPPDRRTGQRQSREIEDIAAECDQRFWMNTQSPRSSAPPPSPPSRARCENSTHGWSGKSLTGCSLAGGRNEKGRRKGRRKGVREKKRGGRRKGVRSLCFLQTKDEKGAANGQSKRPDPFLFSPNR